MGVAVLGGLSPLDSHEYKSSRQAQVLKGPNVMSHVFHSKS